MSATFYEATAPEIVSTISFFDTKKKEFDNGVEIEVTTELLNFIGLALASMSTVIKSNCITILKDKVQYVDRVFIGTLHQQVCRQPVEELRIHRIVLEFIEHVATETPLFTFSSNGSLVFWNSSIDPSFQAVLAMETCIAPSVTDDDVANLVPLPTEQQTLYCSPAQLLEGVSFFSGLFELSPWKPINFIWDRQPNGDQNMILSYIHPSTEIEKKLLYETIGGSLKANKAVFQLLSDSIKNFVNRMDTNFKVTMKFNEKVPDEINGAGVLLECYNDDSNRLYSAVLAKMKD